MKVKFNFNLEAWIQGVEIEADSIEEAKNKLYRMDVQELIEAGYINTSDLYDVEGEVIEDDTDEDNEIDDSYEDYDVKLIHKILKANNIKLKELDEYGSDGYWIDDSIRNLKDLESIYEDFIKPLNNPQLEKEFIDVTHFDVTDEDNE